MDEMSGIIVEHVYKSFGMEQILTDVSMKVLPGKIFGIVGNNGSGKTVLMKCICGFLKPDSGIVRVNGKIVGKACDFPEDLGVIIETPGFLPNLTGYQNLKILASLKGVIGKKEIREVLLQVGLDPDMRKPVGKYSLGMRQRLGIAQAIMEKPKVLILDEPTAGLDPMGRELLLSQIMQYHRERKNTVLLVSHSMEDIARVADRIIVMNNSKLEMFETTKKVFSHGRELEKIGLRVPQITRIMSILKDKGYDVDDGALNVGDALMQITALLKKEGKIW